MEFLIQWGHETATGYGPKLLTGAATLLIGWVLARLLTTALRSALKGSQVDPTAASFCANLAYVAMLALVVITALDKIGFPAVSFAAVLGAAGLAIGLALKGLLSNFAAGVLLIMLRPFNVGDQIEAAGVKGVITRIQVFATVFQAADDKRIIVPNAAITSGNITNYS